MSTNPEKQFPSNIANNTPLRLMLTSVLLGIAAFLLMRNDPETVVPENPSRSHARLDKRSPGAELPPAHGNRSPISGKPAAGHQATTAGARDRQDSAAALDQLGDAEQRSLWQAFSEARREVRPIPEAWAGREENRGYDFYALNPKQQLNTRFGARGVGIGASDRTYTEEDARNPHTAWALEMHLHSFAGVEVVPGAMPRKTSESGNRMEYDHGGGLIEWYVNQAEGLEHGYTISQRPGHLGSGAEVSLEVALSGLQAVEKPGDDGLSHLVFQDAESREVLAYDKLEVIDADGRSLRARMSAVPGGLLIAYQDREARYPVTIDPLITSLEAKITANDAAAGDNFGVSVSVSGDTAVVGANGNDDAGSGSGSAYVFVSDVTGWHMQAKLAATDAAAGDLFGYSVSVFGDTALVGAMDNDDAGIDSGSAYVFVRSGMNWSQQAKLIASDAAVIDEFGYSVSVSGDTALVGARGDNDAGADSGSAYVFVRSGSGWSQQAKLTANDAAAFDYFGYSVSVSGDTALIGAYDDDDRGADSGSAYVFMRSGASWSQQAKLTANDAAATDNFAISVSVSGDTALVGAHADDDWGGDSGSAYVFVREVTSWGQQWKLTASDTDDFDYLGTSVSLSGDTAIVVAYSNDDAGDDSGCAYVFVRSGTSWIQQAKLTASDASAADNFGYSVSLSGDTVLVGAINASYGNGSAYVFVRSGAVWSQQAILKANNDAAAGSHLAYSVSVSGDTALVGAPNNNEAGSDSGSVYVFVRSGAAWSQQAKLTASDAAGGDHFGNSVSASGDTAVVGASSNGDAGSFSGSAYVFVRSGTNWNQQAKLTASDAAAGDNFGYSVNVSGNTLVVGAPLDDDAGSSSGSAYVFVRSGAYWSQQAKLTANDAAASDRFGNSVSVSGDTALVGSIGDDLLTGSAYAFTRSGSGWSQQAKLTANDADTFSRFGISVSVSGDTVLVGSSTDTNEKFQCGSAYVFRLAVDGQRSLLVQDQLDSEILPGGTAATLPGQQTGTALSYTWRLSNMGSLGLDLQTISLGGADAGQFSLLYPSISANPDLVSGADMDVTLTFSPGGSSGLRQAILIITSNDSETPVYSANIQALALSPTTDTDGDGMNDWAEYLLRGNGFDWTTNQTNKVNDFYNFVSAAGLYSQNQVGGVLGGLGIHVNQGTVKLTIGLEESADLESFLPHSVNPAGVSVNGNGDIEYNLGVPAGKKFYRAKFK